MHILNSGNEKYTWSVNKIAVVGPGIVGMPMAAFLAHAKICEGTDKPAKVIVIQRNSPTSGWKVQAINSGRSVIGGIEPGLDRIVSIAVSEGLLSASYDFSDLSDADVILVCVQTDKEGFGPDYGPMLKALTDMASALQSKPAGKMPLIIFESTLAPSSMNTLIKDHFEGYGLKEGRDILIGNSPNRVMPGRLVERVADSDKLIGGLSPITTQLIKKLYSNIVTKGDLHITNSLTAEIVKTLENAYRDVRIAYAAETVRYCDRRDFDFYQLRQQVNNRLAQTDAASEDPNVVPSGGLLIPTIGVGGHCLPKDGILLWWRKIESGSDTSRSLILEARHINDESPGETISLAERHFGDLANKPVALLGTAYRFNSEDTRNSPTLALALQLIEKGCKVRIHDPYVKATDQNLIRFALYPYFTRDIAQAVESAEYLIFCTAHRVYADEHDQIIRLTNGLRGILDGCNLFHRSDFMGKPYGYVGIGRGTKPPPQAFVDFVYEGFRVMERGLANELLGLIDFFNDRYVNDDFNRIVFREVQQIAGTCVTGCSIANPGLIETIPVYDGFSSRLVKCAYLASHKDQSSEV